MRLPTGLDIHIEPPQQEIGEEPLFRVIYIIDVNAADPRAAADYAYQIMSDPGSIAPVLHVVDQRGKTTVIDLSDGKA